VIRTGTRDGWTSRAREKTSIALIGETVCAGEERGGACGRADVDTRA
jgi:hypothetical protein